MTQAFQQSPRRQFIQSAGRQRDTAGFLANEVSYFMSVIGLARVGGFVPYVSGVSAGRLYLTCEAKITGVKVIDNGDSTYSYEPHTFRAIRKFHPLVGDAYSYEEFQDSTLVHWYYVSETGGPSDIGDAPGPDGWEITGPPSSTNQYTTTIEGGPDGPSGIESDTPVSTGMS